MIWYYLAVLVAVSTMNFNFLVDSAKTTIEVVEKRKTEETKISKHHPSYILIKTLKEKYKNDLDTNFIICNQSYNFRAVESLSNQDYIRYVTREELNNLEIEEIIQILF